MAIQDRLCFSVSDVEDITSGARDNAVNLWSIEKRSLLKSLITKKASYLDWPSLVILKK